MLVRARQPQGGRPERGSSLHQHSSGRTRERPAIQRADYEPNRSCAPRPSPPCSVMTELRRSGPLRERPPPRGRPPLTGPGTVTRPLLIAPEYTAREENVARRLAFRSGASNRPPDPTCRCRGPTRRPGPLIGEWRGRRRKRLRRSFRLPRLRGLQLHAGLVAVRENDAGGFECVLNSKTLFVCRRAKSVLNLREQGNAETCSRAEPVARPTEKLPRGLDLSAGDHPFTRPSRRSAARALFRLVSSVPA